MKTRPEQRPRLATLRELAHHGGRVGVEQRLSAIFLMSDGTTADFEEFFRQDPIGAAQYATGLAQAAQGKFDGLEEMQKMLEAPELSLEERKKRLTQLGAKSQTVFKFVAATEAKLQQREETLGWTTQ